MNFDPEGRDYPLYNTQLAEARRREKRMMLINCTKLGSLLLIYVIFNRVMLYPYYILAASVHSGQFIPLPSDAIKYIRSHEELIDSTSFSMAGNLFLVVFSVLFVLLIARLLFRVDISDMMRPRLRHIGQGMLWMPMCLMINTLISILVSILQNYLSHFGVTIPESDFTIKTPDTLSIVMQFCYVILIGPLAEELIYRGLILTLLRPFGKWLAVLMSAILFGMMHGNIPQMSSAFASALVMGIVAVQCGSIVPTLIIHICNNVMASWTDFADALGWQYGTEVYMGMQIMIFFAGTFAVFVYSYRLKIKEAAYALTAGQRFGQVFLSIPMLVYMAYLIVKIVAGFIKAN